MSMKVEEWRDIPGYSGFYQISDWGRVRSFCKQGPGPKKRADEPHMIKPIIGNRAATLFLRKEGEISPKSVAVARLMAETWIGVIPEGAVVCHKNGDFRDNSVWNLFIGKNGTAAVRYMKETGVVS